MPILNRARYAPFAVCGLLVAGTAGLIEASQHTSADGLRGFLAAALGWAVIGLALTLPGCTLGGFLLGGFFVGAGILSWTFSEQPGVVWAFLAIEGLVFAALILAGSRGPARSVWSGLRGDLIGLPKLGAAWLGLAYWVFGALGAALAGAWKVSAQRVVYGGLFILAALAVLVIIRRTRRDPTPAIAGAFLIALGLLLIVGSGNALENLHAVPDTAWGRNMEYRFWGGPGFLYHPNSIALIAVLVSLRIAPDKMFAPWQRYGTLAASFLMLVLVTSRTAWGFALAAAVVHVVLVWRRRLDYRRTVAAAVLPFVLLGALMMASGGPEWLVYNRYPNAAGGGDITSGRVETWKQVVRDFRADTIAERVFGNADNARGTVCRTNAVETDDVAVRAALCGPDAVEVNGVKPPKLTTDNAFFGALRRGGVLGVCAFLVGLVLLVWRAVRRGAAPWFTITVVAVLPTIAVSDWLLGGTGGTLWIMLLAAEAWAVSERPSRTPRRVDQAQPSG